MIFTYWDDGRDEPIRAQRDHWREAFADYRVTGPHDARAALGSLAPHRLDLFDRIRIPACRSDIARLALLVAEGGLYVDAHCRIRDRARIEALLDRRSEIDTLVCTRWAVRFETILPHNSILWSRRGSLVLRRILDQALDNLAELDAREADLGWRPYHIWDASGPGVIWHDLFDTTRVDGVVRQEMRGKVQTVPERDCPIDRHVFVGYQPPQAHWSERQKSEPLFSRAAE